MATSEQTSSTALSEAWPHVSRRLYAYLRRRRLSSVDADDIAQSVAERVIRHDVAFDDADHLLHWCLTTARHLHIDRQRARSRHHEVGLEDIHSLCDERSLEDGVVTRLRLLRTTEAINGMRPQDREAIVRSLDPSRPATGRERVALHRARARLLELVGPAAIFVGCGRRLLRTLARPATFSTGLSAAAFVSVLIVIADGGSSTHSIMRDAVARAPANVTKLDTTPERGASSLVPPGHNYPAPLPTPSAAPAHPIIAAPDGGATVKGHDRRPQDSGILCVRHLPVPDTCVGPTSVPVPVP